VKAQVLPSLQQLQHLAATAAAHLATLSAGREEALLRPRWCLKLKAALGP
jgi:hypothetical protein